MHPTLRPLAVVLPALLSMFAGCASNHVTVIGMDVQPNCANGLLPYVWPQERIAVCWPRSLVAYVACVEHLSVASTTMDETRKLSAEAGIKALDKVAVDPKLTLEDAKKYVAQMVNDGKIGEARAEAILTCSQLLKSDAATSKAVQQMLTQ